MNRAVDRARRSLRLTTVVEYMSEVLSTDCTSTRGHCCKLYKGYSQVNTHKYFFSNRICDIWNALPSSVVEASSLTVFKRLLDNVDLTRYFIDIR